MKRAEDWLDDWDNETKWTRLSLIEAIQRDALLHAAAVCQKIGADWTWNLAVEKSAAAEYLQRAIDAEADKLKPCA